MAIQMQDGPEDGFAILQERLPDAYRHQQERKADGGGAAPEEIDLSRPHQVFSIDLHDLVGNDPLDQAKSIAWRYMLMNGTDAVASAELTTETGGSAEYAGFFKSQFDRATIEAVNRMEGKLHEDRDYEMRLLRIPEIYVIAVWLHSDVSDEFLPLEGVPPELEQFAIYDRAAMSSALKTLGAAKLKDIAAEAYGLEEGMESEGVTMEPS